MSRVIHRIAACPGCLKYNKVPATWIRYVCGHCGIVIDGSPVSTELDKLEQEIGGRRCEHCGGLMYHSRLKGYQCNRC